MALADTITALGTSIINLVGTRAKTDLSNITTAGQDIIKSLSSSSGIPVGTVIAYMSTATDPNKFVIADMADGRYLMGPTVAGSRRNNDMTYNKEILG